MTSSSSSSIEPKDAPGPDSQAPESDASSRARTTLDNFLNEVGQNTVTDVLWGNIGTMNRIYSGEATIPEIDVQDFVDELMGGTVKDLVHDCLLDFCGEMNRVLGSPTSDEEETIDLTPPESLRKKRKARESLAFDDDDVLKETDEGKNFMDFGSDKDAKPASPRMKRIVVTHSKMLPMKRIVRTVRVIRRRKPSTQGEEKPATKVVRRRVVKKKAPAEGEEGTVQAPKKRLVRKVVKRVAKTEGQDAAKKPVRRVGKMLKLRPKKQVPQKGTVKRIMRKKSSAVSSPRGGDSESSALIVPFSDSDSPAFEVLKEESSDVSRYSDLFSSDSFYSSYYSDDPEEEKAKKRPKQRKASPPVKAAKKVVKRVVKRAARAASPEAQPKKTVVKKAPAAKKSAASPKKAVSPEKEDSPKKAVSPKKAASPKKKRVSPKKAVSPKASGGDSPAQPKPAPSPTRGKAPARRPVRRQVRGRKAQPPAEEKPAAAPAPGKKRIVKKVVKKAKPQGK